MWVRFPPAAMSFSRQTNPFVMFMFLYSTYCPSACYNRICAHYKWVRFAETHVLETPVSPQSRRCSRAR